jgi:hypothetical protein
VANIRRENVKKVIENFASFDDNHFATTASGGAFIKGNARSEMIRLTHLFRIRRLMELGRAAPKVVGAELTKSLRRGLAAWPDAFHKERELHIQAGGGLCKRKPTAHDQIRTRVTACTYLLAELGSPSHLPLLLASYRAQAKWMAQIPEEHYRWIPQTPIPPAIALYAMHRVIASLPQDKLGPRERAAREKYMAWANRHLPPAKEIEVSSWNADYDESDPRVRFMDPDGTVLRGQRTIRMVVYPHRFVDSTPMQKYPAAPYLPERVQEWAESLCALAELIVGDKQEALSVEDLKKPWANRGTRPRPKPPSSEPYRRAAPTGAAMR